MLHDIKALSNKQWQNSGTVFFLSDDEFLKFCFSFQGGVISISALHSKVTEFTILKHGLMLHNRDPRTRISPKKISGKEKIVPDTYFDFLY